MDPLVIFPRRNTRVHRHRPSEPNTSDPQPPFHGDPPDHLGAGQRVVERPDDHLKQQFLTTGVGENQVDRIPISRSLFRCNQGGRQAYSSGRPTKTIKKATTAMKKQTSASKEGREGDSPSQLIDGRIKELTDWRGETLARIRILVKQADPEVVEEWKWRGVPVWSHSGIICTGETYKKVVKMTFAKGASLEDPSGLFNSSLDGNTRRAIDFHEGDKIEEKALKALIRAAVALNTSSAGQRPGNKA
jgi:hypothetical protein